MHAHRIAIVIGLLAALGESCGEDPADDDGNDEGSPDQVGAQCESPADCYPGSDHAALQGEVICLDRVTGGYCTHQCVDDADCCAVEGECVSEFPQVCSPFESADEQMCFLSCESEYVDASGAADEQSYCHGEVSYDFMCRSSGGGSNNRKICVPGDCGVGATCGDGRECAADLECVDGFDGGYCGRRDCGANADCPGDSLCIALDGESYCVKACDGDGDCELCRDPDHPAACTEDVEFVEAGTSGAVCLGAR